MFILLYLKACFCHSVISFQTSVFLQYIRVNISLTWRYSEIKRAFARRVKQNTLDKMKGKRTSYIPPPSPTDAVTPAKVSTSPTMSDISALSLKGWAVQDAIYKSPLFMKNPFMEYLSVGGTSGGRQRRHQPASTGTRLGPGGPYDCNNGARLSGHWYSRHHQVVVASGHHSHTFGTWIWKEKKPFVNLCTKQLLSTTGMMSL